MTNRSYGRSFTRSICLEPWCRICAQDEGATESEKRTSDDRVEEQLVQSHLGLLRTNSSNQLCGLGGSEGVHDEDFRMYRSVWKESQCCLRVWSCMIQHTTKRTIDECRRRLRNDTPHNTTLCRRNQCLYTDASSSRSPYGQPDISRRS